MSTVALIPARGGSRRVPRKNVKSFHGVPAIARVIATLQASGLFDAVVVSTDDDEIADVAQAAGGVVPFRRPAELSDDRTGARPVIQHAVRELELDDADTLAVVYPTAVLLSTDDVVQAHSLLTSDVDFVLTVAEFPAPIRRALALGPAHEVQELNDSDTFSRTQDLDRAFHDVGQMYWGRASAWKGDVPVVRAHTRAFVLPSWRAVDIDTPEDWEHAERVFELVTRER